MKDHAGENPAPPYSHSPDFGVRGAAWGQLSLDQAPRIAPGSAASAARVAPGERDPSQPIQRRTECRHARRLSRQVFRSQAARLRVERSTARPGLLRPRPMRTKVPCCKHSAPTATMPRSQRPSWAEPFRIDPALSSHKSVVWANRRAVGAGPTQTGAWPGSRTWDRPATVKPHLYGLGSIWPKTISSHRRALDGSDRRLQTAAFRKAHFGRCRTANSSSGE